MGFYMRKRQALDFSEAIEAYDIKVDICNQLNDFFFINTKAQSFIDPFDLYPGCLRFSYLIFFTSKTAGLIETKLHVALLLDVGNESLFMGSGSHDEDGCHAHIW